VRTIEKDTKTLRYDWLSQRGDQTEIRRLIFTASWNAVPRWAIFRRFVREAAFNRSIFAS
jgi:hypothetical protein